LLAVHFLIVCVARFGIGKRLERRSSIPFAALTQSFLRVVRDA
jgi:hypothetical protein